MQYLGSDDQGVSSFSLQDLEPSFGSKMNAAVRESWLESYGPVAMDYVGAKFGGDGTKRLSALEATDYAKQNGGGVKLNLTPKDNQYTIGQWSTIVERQRELAAVKDVRERTPWDMGSVLRGGAMFGAGIVDPINLATAFVPWTKAIGAANGLRAAAMAESALTRAGARAALGAADAGISTAALEPLYALARNELGDDYTAMDSLANIAFGTAFGGGLHVLGGAAGDAFRSYRARGAVAPAVMTPELQAAVRDMTPEQRAEAGIAPESARAGMPEIVEPLTAAEMAPYTGRQYNETPTLNEVFTPGSRQTPDSPVVPTPEPAPEKRRDLLDALKSNGGIAPSLARDAGGENGMRLNRKLPGVVKKTGLTEYDQVAEMLGEQGFLRPGTEPGSQDAIDQAQDMVARAFNGDRVVRWEDTITEAQRRQEMDRQDYLDSLRRPEASASAVVTELDPETREAALRASVAQSVDGRNVDVDAIVGMDESLASATTDDAIAAADRNFTPEQVATADFDAAAAVTQRVETAPKWDAVSDAEAAMTEADALLSDTVKAGDQAFKYSRRLVDAETLPTIETLTESLRQSFGSSTERLLDEGRVKLVATPDEIPGGPHPGDVKGATAPDGTVYIVAQNVSELEARGMLLHEVGVHVGMERMLGAEVFQSVLSELDAAIARGEAWAQAARSAVPADTPAGLVREEQLAYLVQNAPEAGIVKRIIAAVKAWAYANFEFARERLSLNEADFRAMAVSALHEAAKGERGGVLAGAYSRASSALNDVLKLWDSAGISHDVSEKKGVITLGKIVVTDAERKTGKGTAAMQSLVEYADRTGQRIELGASSQLGGDKARLVDFYQRFGFQRKPRSAPVDKPFRDTAMFRDPRTAASGENTIKYSRGETPDTATAAEELKPYDDAVKRAKQFAGVLRAAADKLDSDAAATAAMRSALPDITAAEISDLIGQLRKQVKGLRGMATTARNAIRSEDVATIMQSDAMKAADELANNLQMAAVIEKRNAALNINARLKATAYVNQFRSAGLDFEGFRGILVGTERKRAGGRISVDAEQKNFRGEWLGGMIADLEQAGLMKQFASGEFDRDVYVALYNLGRDGKGSENLPPEAVKIAEVVNKYQTDARNTRNRFGAWIRDLNGYITRQSHDMFKIRGAGEAKFTSEVLPLLDVQKSMRDFDGSVDQFLSRVYDDFAAGTHMKTPTDETDIAALGRGSSLAKKVSQSRVLYFKDGAAAYEYNAKYGQGKLADSVLSGLDASAKAAGLLKLLGTNPEATIIRTFDEYAESLRGDPDRRNKFLNYRKELENLLAHVDGTANIPGNFTAAKIAGFTRAWISMSRLGGMLLSSVTDLSNYAAELRFGQNKNLLSGTLEGIGALTQGRSTGEKRAVLNSLGVFHESTLGSVFARFDNPDLIGGKMSWAMQQFFKLSGINWWTESLRDGYALSHSAFVASQAGKTFDKIDASLRDMLGLYNIDAGKWEILRMANLQEADGRKYITPEGLRTVPREALEKYITSVGRTVSDSAVQNLRDDLSAALRTMTIDRMHHAVIEPGARTRAFMLRGTQPGTVPGELLRFMWQFKSFPVALIQSTLGREVYGRGYDTLGQYLKNGKGDMVGLATFIALSTSMGYAAMAAKDLLRGKNPRPVDDPRTWAAAFVQGGGLGIYGDFLFGKFNRSGNSLSGSMAGPAGGVLDTAADLWTRIRTGDDVAATAFNAALSNTPFMNLFYTRVALDYLILYRIQEALNPGFLRRMERRLERENGQTFYLPPSRVAQ